MKVKLFLLTDSVRLHRLSADVNTDLSVLIMSITGIVTDIGKHLWPIDRTSRGFAHAVQCGMPKYG